MFEVGKSYLIKLGTRGCFWLEVTGSDSEDVEGVIVAGSARCAFGVKSSGDRLKLKISECGKATEQHEENTGLVKSRLSENQFRER